jgi:hypothetical protein
MDQVSKQNISFSGTNLAKLIYLLCFAIFEVLFSTFLIVRGRFDKPHPEVFVSINGYASSLVGHMDFGTCAKCADHRRCVGRSIQLGRMPWRESRMSRGSLHNLHYSCGRIPR